MPRKEGWEVEPPSGWLYVQEEGKMDWGKLSIFCVFLDSDVLGNFLGPVSTWQSPGAEYFSDGKHKIFHSRSHSPLCRAPGSWRGQCDLRGSSHCSHYECWDTNMLNPFLLHGLWSSETSRCIFSFAPKFFHSVLCSPCKKMQKAIDHSTCCSNLEWGKYMYLFGIPNTIPV